MATEDQVIQTIANAFLADPDLKVDIKEPFQFIDAKAWYTDTEQPDGEPNSFHTFRILVRGLLGYLEGGPYSFPDVAQSGGGSFNFTQGLTTWKNLSASTNYELSVITRPFNDQWVVQTSGLYMFSYGMRLEPPSVADVTAEARVTVNGGVLSQSEMGTGMDGNMPTGHLSHTFYKRLNANDVVRVQMRSPDIVATWNITGWHFGLRIVGS